jgi:ABC-type sugar transport system ATPase subunit
MTDGTGRVAPPAETAGSPSRAAGGPVYAATGVSMSFGDTRALEDADFEARTGQVHALLGANGAGKSTLVKILAGVMRPMSGTLTLEGEEVEFTSGRYAAEAGIATVSQELNLFPDLSVQENLFLMREPLRGGTVVRDAEMRSRAAPVLDRIGLRPAVLGRPLRSLSLGARQLVEIGRALLEEPKVLILDEPTSALKASETRRLLEVVKELRSQDVSVIFVSHFLEDVFGIADTITVLRNGRVIEQGVAASTLTPESAITSMLGGGRKDAAGAEVSARSFPIPPASKKIGPLVLEEASSRGAVRSLSMTAEPGEVVGLAGVEGSGAAETLRLLFGDLKLTGGSVTLPGGGGAPRNRFAAVRSGIAYVPADRKGDGLILDAPIYENVTMVTAGPLGRLGFLPRRRAKMARVEAWREAVGLTMASSAAAVEHLSGGNQQKVAFAKWLEPAPSLVLLDDPTRGVDVGAKVDMLRIIRAVADSGRVVLYTSTDLGEMARVCDRVLVFYRGEVLGELTASAGEDELLDAITRGSIKGAA